MAPQISGVDQTETIVALQKRFGTSYILYGCKSQPRQALNIVLTSWGKELPVLSLGRTIPDFRACTTVQDVFKTIDLWLAEYEGKIVEEAETLAEEVERITAAAAALDTKPDVSTDTYGPVTLGSSGGEPVVVPAPTVDSLDRFEVANRPSDTFEVYTAPDGQPAIALVERQPSPADEFKGITLVQLRRASKGGVVKNGYDKTRAELEDALYAAGVSRAKALAAK